MSRGSRLHFAAPALLALMAAACAPRAHAGAAAPALPEPPAPLADRPLEFPLFRETTLSNGLPLLIVEHPGQPVATVSLYIRSGSSADPVEQAGLADLAADLLTKGTDARSSEEISETIEGVGGRLDASASQDFLSISATILEDHLPLAMDLLSDVALRPTFPEEEFQLARRRTLSGLEAALGQPGTLAEQAFLEEVYGKDHPYGVGAVPATVSRIDLEDVRAFHRGNFGPSNALLVVAGAVDAARVQALADRYFGNWSAAAPEGRRFPEPPVRVDRRITLIHRPGSVQSNIWVGHIGVRPDTPDYFAIQVLNQILGGGSVSRLQQVLRDERGWTYGAYSLFTRPRDLGFFAAVTEVRTEVTDSAVAEIVSQMERLQHQPIPAREFDAAVSYLAGSFPLRIETPGQIASQIALSRLLGRPLEHVTEYRERIRAVTPADVQRVAREYVRPEQAAIVVVGDATLVAPGIRALAPLSIRDVEGRPVEGL